ncbi:MAG: cytochrome c [Ferruginibacter sp.]
MKRNISIVTVLLSLLVSIISSCDGHKTPGRIYMPDMTYSRAVETYSLHDSTLWTLDPNHKGGNQIFYNSIPAAGTIKRGELYPYTLPNDSNGYKLSATIKNPLDSVSKTDLTEAGRLFNINCAICHGSKGIANGPIAAGGYVGGVANLTLPQYLGMADGTMFHSITYGKNNMGSYASQLDRKQRWTIVKYIRTLQGLPVKGSGPAITATEKDSTDSKTVKDTTAKAMVK